MFYEDQHKLAAYLERTGAEYEFNACEFDPIDDSGGWVRGNDRRAATQRVKNGLRIRPVLRHGLPSHLQSEIANPDNLTEEQICEGGKYRACVKRDKAEHGLQGWGGDNWVFYHVQLGTAVIGLANTACRLPATVPWPDWEQEAAQPDPKDARIAELEMQLLALSNSCETLRETCSKITSPWRRMSEVPTEEDADDDGCVPVIDYAGAIRMVAIERWTERKLGGSLEAWMPVPKLHGWPDPLADLLKAHGVEVTPELTAALNAWKGVEK